MAKNEIAFEDQLKGYSSQITDGLISAAASFLQIGEALVSAKLLIDDDGAFGKWRIDNTPIKSGRTASAYMQVYRRFAQSKLVGNVPYSVLQELVSAPDEVVEQIEAMDEAPTVKETRELVKDAKAEQKDGSIQEEPQAEVEEKGNQEVLPPDESKRTVRTTGQIIAESEGATKEPTVPSWLTEEQAMLGMPELDRIKTAGICWHILGLSAYFETMPSKSSVNRLVQSLLKSYPDQEEPLQAALGYAIDEIDGN